MQSMQSMQSTIPKKPLSNTFISKYKPYFIDDFCIDPNLTTVLKTFIEIDNLNILLIGNSSSGKTTLLHAIIREYYNLSKTASFPENNILFINNLKEQGIQYYRNEMKTFCQSHSGIPGKKKLVILDDLDNINEQSQQVFRNYIDKYKNNINVISVCTNIQKVIESIQSRLHILKLTQPTREQNLAIMNKIIETENLQIDEPTKHYLLAISGNSIRIIINYLEKMTILNLPVDTDLCKKICFNISFQKFETFLHLCTFTMTPPTTSDKGVTESQGSNLSKAVDILYEIYDYGYSVIDILDYFFIFIKMTTIIDENTKYRIIPHICKNITVFHNIHEDGIELAIFANNIYNIIHHPTVAA